MRMHEITKTNGKPAGQSGGIAPLSPAESRSRAKKKAAAAAKVNDTLAMNAVKLRAARRRLAEI
jgi:hypothetical protein